MSLALDRAPRPIFARRQIYTGVLVIAAMLAFAVLWLLLVHSVRIKELRYRLLSGTDQSGSVRTLTLVSRYKMLRQSGMASNYAQEGRIMHILAETARNPNDELDAFEFAAKATVDFFDFLTGTPPYRYIRHRREQKLIERAFYHELTRTYKEAIAAYDAALRVAPKMDAHTKAYTLLHRGFCEALSSRRASAIDDFRTVIASQAQEEYRETARILLAMLLDIEAKLARVDAMGLSLEKAEAYYSLTAYDKAVDTLHALGPAANGARARFYLARSLEESGQSAAAAKEYRQTISQNAGSNWAMQANRRLYALGSYYAAGKEYRHESKRNIEQGIVQDQELLQEATRFERVSERIEEGERRAIAAFDDTPVPVALAVPESTPAPSTKPAPTVPVARQAAVKPNPVPATPVLPTTPVVTQQASLPEAEPVPAEVVNPPKQVEAETLQGRKPTGPDWEKLLKLPRAEKSAYINRQASVENVMLENGNQFRGLKMSESKKHLILFTALGRVTVIKSEIESRETTAP